MAAQTEVGVKLLCVKLINVIAETFTDELVNKLAKKYFELLFVSLNGLVAETLINELVDKLVEGEVEVMGMKRGVNAKTFGDSMFDI